MNCNQARAILAAYRELKNGEVDTIELDVHLEGCASCREELARYMLIGDQIRSLPIVEPLPDMHAKLMQALAQEQVKFIWSSKPGTVSTPEFLKPYIQGHAQSTHDSNMIAAFSTAETGPLPVIQAKRKRPIKVNVPPIRPLLLLNDLGNDRHKKSSANPRKSTPINPPLLLAFIRVNSRITSASSYSDPSSPYTPIS